MVAAATTRSQRHPGSLLDENAEHLLRERATMERIKARRLLLPALAHNDAPTVPDAAATRDLTAALAAAQKRVDTMSTGVQVYWCPRSSSAGAGDHQHLDEVLKSCVVGSVQGSGRGLVQVPMWRQSRCLQQTG